MVYKCAQWPPTMTLYTYVHSDHLIIRGIQMCTVTTYYDVVYMCTTCTHLATMFGQCRNRSQSPIRTCSIQPHLAMCTEQCTECSVLYQCPIPQTRPSWEHWVMLNMDRSPEFTITSVLSKALFGVWDTDIIPEPVISFNLSSEVMSWTLRPMSYGHISITKEDICSWWTFIKVPTVKVARPWYNGIF